MPQTNKKWEVVSPLSKPGLGEVTDGQPLKYWSSLKVLSAWSPNVLTLWRPDVGKHSHGICSNSAGRERDMFLYPLGYHVLEYKESESVVSSPL